MYLISKYVQISENSSFEICQTAESPYSESESLLLSFVLNDVAIKEKMSRKLECRLMKPIIQLWIHLSQKDQLPSQDHV